MQKTDVLMRWVEMYECIKAAPHSVFSPPIPTTTHHTNKLGTKSFLDPMKGVGEGERHMERRRHADIEAECNMVTCIPEYLQLMSVLQKGIDRLHVYQEHAAMRFAPGEDVVLSVGFNVGERIVCFRLCAFLG
jgi:serine/threonine-protein kinase ULK/ATG1